ncbi:4-alpha-glucanotransferase [uncultured Jannaschia sp.]|uniref:4-alpha-glucanotransferase n=1 Tax=uncultured Jannaschia sp. TaxID=293347 RepID=UPI00262E5F16|nr:4-alpha-glucanotransferase [uncultured Jannaschia sp.]
MSLRSLARHHGLTTAYEERDVPDTTLALILERLGVDSGGAPSGAPAAEAMPSTGARAPRPARGWGVFCQLYELRSDRNWGIGDFSDLARLARTCGMAGADFLGVNPLHALFLAAPEHCSPFSPSNRRFLNPLYIAPDTLGCERPDDLPDADLVDYAAVTRAKLGALRAAFAAAGDDPDFDAFLAEEGEALRLHALFEVISAGQSHVGWTGWPKALQDPHGAAASEIGRTQAEDVRFQQWLQYVARTQLRAAQKAAKDAGMRIGLYLDLAVGEAQDGSATWSGTAAAMPGLGVGAPPDVFSEHGQNWDLAAPSPEKMARDDYAAYRAMIGAQLRDAGALRIDHAMAIWQLFLIPAGEPAANGTHLRYPMADLLRVLCEEAHRNDAILIGEDLGFVPSGFREVMTAANILSYRIVYFEQDETGFDAAGSYPEVALACLSTHDLPILSAWWTGQDIDLREANGLVSPEASVQHRAHREKERRDLVRAFGVEADPEAETLPDAVLDAAHAFMAATPCLLAGVRLADLVGPETPTNLPGVTDGHPNWRPRSSVAVDDIADHPVFARVTGSMRTARPRS